MADPGCFTGNCFMNDAFPLREQLQNPLCTHTAFCSYDVVHVNSLLYSSATVVTEKQLSMLPHILHSQPLQSHYGPPKTEYYLS